MRYTPFTYQKTALEWIMAKPRCALFLDMGLGKTVVALTAVRELTDFCEVSRVLVVAPKKVAETTWSSEAAKWDHLSSLRVSLVAGTEKKRREALAAPADVYVVGRDNLVWLCGVYGGRLPFDMLILDELTSFKNPKSRRFRALRTSSAGIPRIVGLTGTPAPNGLADLWAQIYCLDRGERLGRTLTWYRERWFSQYIWNGIPIRLTPKAGAETEIRNRISDICLSMSASDWLELPDMIIHTEKVDLPPAVRRGYEEFERERVLEFAGAHGDESGEVLAASAAGLMNKLSQYANGSVYDSEGVPHEVHGEKMARLAELVEAAASPVLVFYQFKFDAPAVEKSLKGLKVRTYKGPEDLAAWNNGEVDVLLAHPASTAYGLNMQEGGHYIVWLGTGWNLELWEQANARLHRQGQRHPVVVYRLLCRDTVDERAAAALDNKTGVQRGLLEALKYIERKHGVT